MQKEKRLKVWREVEHIKKEEGVGSSGDRRHFRLPRLSLDLMKWKGGAAKRRRKGKTEGVYTSEEGKMVLAVNFSPINPYSSVRREGPAS